MIEEHRILPAVGHYGCMVDLFGKSGDLDVGGNLIHSMLVHALALIWMTLLGACRNLGEIKRGEMALNHISLLEPDNGAPYILLSNIYATNGRWNDVKMLKETWSNEELRNNKDAT